MSKPTKTSEGPVRIYQWVTDGTELDPITLAQHSAILVQVEGDLAGGEVIIRGGINSPSAALEVVRSTPALVSVPGVRLLSADAPAGITITVMGTP